MYNFLMFDIDEIAKLYSSKPLQGHYYDVLKNEFISISDVQLRKDFFSKDNPRRDIYNNEKNRYIHFPRYSLSFLRSIANDFMEKEASICINFEYSEPLSLSKFERFIKENGLYDKWISFLGTNISYDIYRFCLSKGIIEKEASPKEYERIKKLISRIEETNYEVYFSDKQLFKVIWNSFNFEFVLLGNMGVSKGINIFASDNSTDIYKSIMESDKDLMDRETYISLCEFISIYINDDVEMKELMKSRMDNPLDDSYHYSIVSLYPGLEMHNYITKSLYKFLELALKRIYLTINEAKKYADKDIDVNQFQQVIDHRNYYFDDYFNIRNLSSKDMTPEGPFYMMSEDEIDIPDGYDIVDEKWSFSLKKLPTKFISEHSDRVFHYSYVAIFANEEEEELIDMVLANTEYGRPVSIVSKAIAEKFNDREIAKEIVINNVFDYFLFDSLFYRDTDAHNIKIIPIGNKTNADREYELFLEEYEKDDELKREDA